MKRMLRIGTMVGVVASLSACESVVKGAFDYRAHLTGEVQALGLDESEILKKDVVKAGYTEEEAKLIVDTVEKVLLGGKRPEATEVKLTHVETVATPISINVTDEMERFKLQLDRAGKPLNGDCDGVRHGVYGYVEKDGSRSIISGAWCRWSGKADWSAVKPFTIAKYVAPAPAKPEPAKATKPAKKKAAV